MILRWLVRGRYRCGAYEWCVPVIAEDGATGKYSGAYGVLNMFDGYWNIVCDFKKFAPGARLVSCCLIGLICLS